MGLWTKALEISEEFATQALLARLGYYRGSLDGQLGPVSRAAIEEFQRSIFHLEPSGICDGDTWGSLCMAAEVASLPPVGRQELGWLPLPEELLEDFDRLAGLCVEHNVSYAPGRGYFVDGRFVVTQGPFGLSSARYRTRDKEYEPAFVCSTWTYFVACYLLRVGEVFNSALGGGQPPIWDVLAAPHEGIQRLPKFGPFLGFRPYFRHWPSRGDSAKRRRKLRHGKDQDLLEVWERFEENPENVPELSVGAWASQRRGFFHHTTALRADREGEELRYIDAGGSKKAGVFSGTDMDITVIRSRSEAEAAQKKGWGRWYGMWAGAELLDALLTRPRYGLGFEVAPGRVEVA